MHVPTHILAGWCVANAVPLTRRERGLAMLAATLPDLDGLGLVVSRDAYETFHHVLGHNVFAGLALTLGLLAFTRPPTLKTAVVYLGLYHLHLLMDWFGSGLDWGIAYLWPLVRDEWMNPWRWPFFSWQNLTAAYGLVALTVVIAARAGRTPLEALTPALDAQLVTLARRFIPAPRGAVRAD